MTNLFKIINESAILSDLFSKDEHLNKAICFDIQNTEKMYVTYIKLFLIQKYAYRG